MAYQAQSQILRTQQMPRTKVLQILIIDPKPLIQGSIGEVEEKLNCNV